MLTGRDVGSPTGMDVSGLQGNVSPGMQTGKRPAGLDLDGGFPQHQNWGAGKGQIQYVDEQGQMFVLLGKGKGKGKGKTEKGSKGKAKGKKGKTRSMQDGSALGTNARIQRICATRVQLPGIQDALAGSAIAHKRNIRLGL